MKAIMRKTVGLCGSRRMFALTAIAMLAMLCVSCLAQAETTQSASPLGNRDVGKSETAVGDLVADAMRAYVKADVAFVAASELKSKDDPIPAGKVSSSDIADLVSYKDDPLAMLQLSGKTIQEALEKAVSMYDWSNLAFLQVSGMKFSFDPSKKPGERISNVTIGGSSIDGTRTYTVAVTNSMANGALGYWKIWSSDNVSRRFADASIIKAVDALFAANQRIDYGNLDRISAR